MVPPSLRRRTRVCIITTGQTGSNPRAIKEAQALHEAGFEVSVIATRIAGRLELTDLNRFPWRFELVDLCSKWRWWSLRAAQLACRGGHAVTGLAGFADLGASPFTAPLRAAALRTPAELYIAHYPPALAAAAAAARHHGTRYAYDSEDFHLGDWADDPSFEQERQLVRRIEGRYLPGAAYVTAAAPMIADALAETYGITRPTVVLNAFPTTQAPRAPSAKGNAEPGPSVYWFSQTIGPDRGLECAVRAIGLARARPHLYLRGLLAAGYGERLDRLAAETGANGHVHILPAAEPEEMERLAAAHDLGLAAETQVSRNRQFCLTNKLFTFLLAGLPPLISATLAQLRFAEEAGLGDLLYPVDDAAALAALIDRLLGDPTLLAATRTKVWRLGQERYNWEVEGARFLPLTGESAVAWNTSKCNEERAL